MRSATRLPRRRSNPASARASKAAIRRRAIAMLRARPAGPADRPVSPWCTSDQRRLAQRLDRSGGVTAEGRAVGAPVAVLAQCRGLGPEVFELTGSLDGGPDRR